jgi:SAM-dependent methyltransferase
VLTVDFDRLGVHRRSRLLDLGSGPGRHAFEAFRRGAHVVCADLSLAEVHKAAEMLAAMRAAGEAPADTKFAVVQADALALPFASGSFDHVIAAEVLEHIPADAEAIGEIARVLRPGGTLAVSVPRWLPERICWALSERYHDRPGGHVRIYRGRELRGHLLSAGLSVTRTEHAHALHAPYWWLRCLVGPDDERAWPVRHYHRFLVWDIVHARRPVRLLERALNPLIGKSLVVYGATA